jgi:hypothetical protein
VKLPLAQRNLVLDLQAWIQATTFCSPASPSTIVGTELLVNEGFERRLCLVLIKPDKML